MDKAKRRRLNPLIGSFLVVVGLGGISFYSWTRPVRYSETDGMAMLREYLSRSDRVDKLRDALWNPKTHKVMSPSDYMREAQGLAGPKGKRADYSFIVIATKPCKLAPWMVTVMRRLGQSVSPSRFNILGVAYGKDGIWESGETDCGYPSPTPSGYPSEERDFDYGKISESRRINEVRMAMELMNQLPRNSQLSVFDDCVVVQAKDQVRIYRLNEVPVQIRHEIEEVKVQFRAESGIDESADKFPLPLPGVVHP